MSFTITDAKRSGVLPLIGMYGKTGSGKTHSALLLMRGLVGPKGRIVLIDTESGRGKLFADLIPGGYRVLALDSPFTPARYGEAFDAAEAEADGVIYDSMSHEHGGEGGVLDMQEAELNRMAGEDWQKRDACKMASWIKPKLAHKKFIQRLLRSKVPLICCLRGEEKTHMVKDGRKMKVITDEFSTPLFDHRFIFEMLVNLETVAREGVGGYVVHRKVSHPDLVPLLPRPNEQVSVAHGEAISRWSDGTSKAKPPTKPLDSRTGYLIQLRDLTTTLHGWKRSNYDSEAKAAKAWALAKAKLQDWLTKECEIEPTLDAMTVEQLAATVAKVRVAIEMIPK